MLTKERHYTIREIAELSFREKWKRHYHSVRRWFKDEPYLDGGMGTKNTTRLYPESTVQRVYERRIRKGKRVG